MYNWERCFDTGIKCPACGKAISTDFEYITCWGRPAKANEPGYPAIECGGGGEGSCNESQTEEEPLALEVHKAFELATEVGWNMLSEKYNPFHQQA